MKIARIDFPTPLLNALRDGQLVIFAGAGVSMGAPANLPNFESLARMIAEGTCETLRDGDPIDEFLGRLQDKGVKVHARAAEVLSHEGLKAKELHRNLLRLYPDAGPVRIVTTNFDLLFEQAAGILKVHPEVFRAPALPLGDQFNGIVHVHGAVTHPDEMVITDKDFGRAYLNKGWARRFLVELFSNFTILFVGYSHNDTIMNYLARAQPPRETNQRFALAPGNNADIQHWHELRIEPITYPQSSKGDHSTLDEGIRRLAELVKRSTLDWHHEIAMIAGNPPPLDEETANLIEYALEDETKTQFFTKSASDPEWIDWLDKNEYLDALFGDGTLSERDRILSRWLIEQFAYNHAAKLFLLIGKHNTCLHPHFWHDLGYRIGRDKETSWDKKILSRWMSLLLTTVQKPVGTNNRRPVDTSIILQRLGEHCIRYEMLDSLLQIFDVMMESRLRLREGAFWLNDENNESPPVNAELPLICKHLPLNELWEKGLKPKLSQVAGPLLDQVIKCLEKQYLTLCAWGSADRQIEPASNRRYAIEPHEQNKSPQAIDVLIDVARDCLEWLVSKQVETAERWCDRYVCSDVPLLRRLAVHGLSKREDLTADEKIDWLLKHTDLHDSPIRHEVFQAVRQAYPEASPERREDLIKAVRVYCWPNKENPDGEITARQHFDWFNSLNKSDPNCSRAKQALDAVLAKYPEFKPSEPLAPDYWRRLYQSPWSPEELLARPAADWLNDLLSYEGSEWDGPGHGNTIESIAKAIRQNFDWGLDLADELDRNERWDTYLWTALIYAWSTMELGEDRHRKVLSWLSKTELYPKHNSEIAKVLYGLVVKKGSVAYALNLLPQANQIATALWPHLDRPEPIEKRNDWFDFAINHHVGKLAIFWLCGFALWYRQQDSKPTTLNNEYRGALSDIVQDQSLPGRLGRAILTHEFAFLLAVDEAWTRDNLLPLFEPDSENFQAAWDGFLSGGHLNPAVAEAMADLFLKAVERIDSDLSNQREQFIKYYISMLADFAETPFNEWIPKFFRHANQETKNCFASEVGNCLLYMDETKQQEEWWQRWLKRYWENRLQGVPAVLESSEVEHMLDWLLHLTSVFPEAVDLAVQMPKASLLRCEVIDELSDSDLLQNHPEAVAKLLIYLWECDRESVRYLAEKSIDKLLPLDIPSELKEKLQEIKVQL